MAFSDISPNTNTFTPAVTFGGASVGITYSSQIGIWYIIGSIVFFHLHVVLTSKGSSAGAFLVDSPPFNAIATYAPPVSSSYNTMLGTIANIVSFKQAGNQKITASKYTAGAFTGLVDTDFTNTSVININGFYFK